MADKKPAISVFGLGKLGCPLAACFAAAGYEVTGIDLNPRVVEAINEGVPPIIESGLPALFEKGQKHLCATQYGAQAVAATDVTFVIVPTPSGSDGTFSNTYVLSACEAIANGLASKETYHLVVITSTVMPGSTGGEIREKLEQHSGKKCGPDFGLCYGPTFVALGTVIRDFLNPDYLLIGESDIRSGDLLEGIYRDFCEIVPPMARMNFVNAEVTKLANNAFVSTKITFGNMLAQLCEHLPNAHVDIITSALGLDSRIGEKYLKGGLGFGGPCLVRDGVALVSMAGSLGSEALLAEATVQSNRNELERLVTVIKSKTGRNDVVGILGLSYKPGSDVIEDSQGLLLATALVAEGIAVVAYDPAAMDQARQHLGTSVCFSESAEDCIQETDLVVITTPWKEFEMINPTAFGPSCARTLIDCWRILDAERFAAVTEYIPLGVGPNVNGPIK